MRRRELPFEGVLGNTVELRVLEHMMSMPKRDFCITEFTRISGVSRTSVDRVVKKFVDWKIVRKAGQRGNMPLYELNEDSLLVRTMYDFNQVIIEIVTPEAFPRGSVAPAVVEESWSEAHFRAAMYGGLPRVTPTSAAVPCDEIFVLERTKPIPRA